MVGVMVGYQDGNGDEIKFIQSLHNRASISRVNNDGSPPAVCVLGSAQQPDVIVPEGRDGMYEVHKLMLTAGSGKVNHGWFRYC